MIKPNDTLCSEYQLSQPLEQHNFEGLYSFPSSQISTSGNIFTPSSPLDFNSELSSSTSSNGVSMPVTPAEQALEDRGQSLASSLDEDDPHQFTNNAISNHYLQSFESGCSFMRSQADSSESHSFSTQSLQSNQTCLQSMSHASRSSGLTFPGSASSDTGDGSEDPAAKKAEQNRAAQRAFRQRKQQYIKWLESKADELNEAYRIVALVRSENEQLRNLVTDLEMNINGGVQGVASAASLISGATISNEVSMNLAISGLGLAGERKSDTIGRPKYNPRSSGYGKRARTKEKPSLRSSPHDEQLQLRPSSGSMRFQNESPWQASQQLQENITAHRNGVPTSPVRDISPSLPLPPSQQFSSTIPSNTQSSTQSIHLFAIESPSFSAANSMSVSSTHPSPLHLSQSIQISQEPKLTGYVQRSLPMPSSLTRSLSSDGFEQITPQCNTLGLQSTQQQQLSSNDDVSPLNNGYIRGAAQSEKHLHSPYANHHHKSTDLPPRQHQHQRLEDQKMPRQLNQQHLQEIHNYHPQTPPFQAQTLWGEVSTTSSPHDTEVLQNIYMEGGSMPHSSWS
ncbi:hypothetical protein BGX27_003626 [Mortierella sp. AM989]|nr:hypothetical protein BGX27_003626 [Mortierella sp. AM989]